MNGLVATSALTAVENKIPNVSNLVKKTDYDTKVNGIKKNIIDHNHDKYITTPEFNKLTAENFVARLAQVTKQILIINSQILLEKLLQIKESIYLLKIS